MHDDDNDDYEPHEHRQVEKPTTDLETLILMVKGIIGVPILALPDAFEYSGWATGIITHCILGGLSINGFHMLVRSQYILCKRHRVPLLTYPETMQLALEKGPRCLRWLSKSAKWIPDAFMILYEIAMCSVYILFSAQNIKQITDYYWIQFDLKIIIAALITPFVLVFLIKNLKCLAFISDLAFIMMLTGLPMIFYYICQDLPLLAERKMFGGFRQYPLYLGTALFAMTSVGTTLSLENTMKNPRHFSGWFGILNIGSLICIVSHSVTGFFGYWKYGAYALPSITLNMPENEILGQAIKILYAVAISISYAIQGHVPVDIWLIRLKKYNPDLKHPKVWECLIRLTVILVSFTIAVLLAELDVIISLLGAMCESLLIIVFPALVEMCVLYPDKYGRCNYLLFKCIFLITLGISTCIIGTYSTIVCFINNMIAGQFIHQKPFDISICKTK